MGWLLILLLGAALLLILWRFVRLDRAALQFVAAAVLLAMAGYAWQGSPGLAGSPAPAAARKSVPESEFSETREAMLGRFDNAASWLTLAESYQRTGDTRSGANVIRAGLKAHPNDADLWVGLGNALIIHAGGMMTPAAELAFRRAARIAPDHPGPKFFYGLALAQGGKFDEAEAIWRTLLAEAPADVSWRAMVEERLMALDQARMMGSSAPLQAR